MALIYSGKRMGEIIKKSLNKILFYEIGYNILKTHKIPGNSSS